MTVNLKELQTRFFQDPQWVQMEELITKFIEPLLDMSTIDTKQPAEHVKAEILGRTMAHKALKDFLDSTKVLTRPAPTPKKNPFE